MLDVVVYLSSLPKIAGRNRKTDVLRAFAAGAESQGMSVLVQDQREVVPARLAVILGQTPEALRARHTNME